MNKSISGLPVRSATATKARGDDRRLEERGGITSAAAARDSGRCSGQRAEWLADVAEVFRAYDSGREASGRQATQAAVNHLCRRRGLLAAKLLAANALSGSPTSQKKLLAAVNLKR
jgi:hypothetical protein